MEKGIVKRNEGRGDIRTAFVFSCPGQEEEKSGLLVNGQTGRNLDTVLSFLKKKRPDLFPSENRYDYRITNSSEQIHYKARDGRTEPSMAELRKPENLERLADDIRDFDTVITFGRCAAEAAKLIADRAEGTAFLYSRHLSFLSLNSSIKTDVNGAPIIAGSPDATLKRLEVAAENILSQLR